jgi:hypothetical protein
MQSTPFFRVAGLPVTTQPLYRAFVLASDDEDVPLGCECAHPQLQIERWGESEEGQSPGSRY